MGILSRIVSMTKAAANEVLDKLESPSLLMNQYLRDLDEQIAQAEQAVVEQQAKERILQTKLDDCSKQMAYYEEKAEQAALEGREFDARTAIEAKLLYQENFEDVLKSQQLTSQAIIEWQQRIEMLKEERTQLQNKRNELMTRLQKVNVNEGFAGFSGTLHASSASQGFNRIEQKIMEWEAQQEVAKGSFSYGAPSGYGVTTSYGASVSSANINEQQQAERSAYVDAELQRLMEKQAIKSSNQQEQ